MKARVQNVSLGNARRIVAVSDVHGNGRLLEQLLEEIAFCKEDALILLGDHIEKGKESLYTLRLVKRLCEAGNAYALQGNCDTLWEDLKAGLYGVDLVEYMDWRKQSLLCDMCQELGLDPHLYPPDEVRSRLESAYGALFAWLAGLPHIIESEDFVFVHAGLDAGPLDEQEAERCLRRDDFLHEAPSFEKFVVAGHMPTPNFNDFTGNILSYSPIIDLQRKVICIDGGNAVKASGQLNALIYSDGAFSSAWLDELPKAVVLRAQPASADPVSIVWQYKEVEILEKGVSESLCRSIHTGLTLWIPNEKLFMHEGKQCSYDHTNYWIPLSEGDMVSVVEKKGTQCFVKHDGVLGWCETESLHFV